MGRLCAHGGLVSGGGGGSVDSALGACSPASQRLLQVRARGEAPGVGHIGENVPFGIREARNSEGVPFETCTRFSKGLPLKLPLVQKAVPLKSV